MADNGPADTADTADNGPAPGPFFARAPRRLRPWRRRLREGLELAAATGRWDVADRYPAAEYRNTRFSLGAFEKAALERLTRQTGNPRWIILTAALHHIAESDAHIPQSPAAAAASRASEVITAKVPRALWPWRSELEQGLQLAEARGDWDACGVYLKEEFAMTRFVMSAATRARIDAMGARRGASQRVVLTVALHALAQEPGFVTQTAPASAIARAWPPAPDPGPDDPAAIETRGPAGPRST